MFYREWPIGPGFEFTGHWLEFINPYAILVGITTLALFMMHGGLYLAMKTEGRLFAKVTVLVRNTSIFFVVAFAIMSIYTLIFFPHLSDRFKELPYLFIFPILALLSIANITRLINKRKYRWAFLFSCLTMSLLLITVAIELYPNIIISTFDETYNMTVSNSSASSKSLQIMLIIAAIGAPLVASYTTFIFWTFRGKVKLDETSY